MRNTYVCTEEELQKIANLAKRIKRRPIPALKLNQTGGELKLDKHPMTGRARISINTWSLEDDGWGGEEMEYDSAAFILTLNDCIKLRDQLTERIEKD